MSAAIAVDLDDPTPPFEQVRRQIAARIESGALAEGDRLPPVRQLAGDLRLAPGTVARAYKELEAAGYVVTRRGGGTRVAPGRQLIGSGGGPGERDGLVDAASRFVVEGRRAGADDARIRAALEAALVRG